MLRQGRRCRNAADAPILMRGAERLKQRPVLFPQAVGFRHIYTKPYTPKTNGKAERFIQSALREWAYAKAYPTSEDRKAELPFWLHHYNWHRPHAGINKQTPISRSGLHVNKLMRLHS